MSCDDGSFPEWRSVCKISSQGSREPVDPGSCSPYQSVSPVEAKPWFVRMSPAYCPAAAAYRSMIPSKLPLLKKTTTRGGPLGGRVSAARRSNSASFAANH